MTPAPSKLLILLLLTVLVSIAGPAAADDDAGGRWAFALGAYDIGQTGPFLEAGVERRFEPFGLWRIELTPMVGVSASEDGNFWAYGGIGWNLDLGRGWRVTPHFAVTAYEDGDGKDLGGVIEFRSGLEISVGTSAGRFGISFYHLSNANIYELNPGSESLLLTWSPAR